MSYTFGDIINTLIDLEENLMAFYKDAEEETKDLSMKEIFREFHKRGREYVGLLLKARRETVVSGMGSLESTLELTFEPIYGVDVDKYTSMIYDVMEQDIEVTEKCIEVERLHHSLLTLLSDSMKKFPKVREVLSDISEEVLNRINKLIARCRWLSK
jgi:hypothetical protein